MTLDDPGVDLHSSVPVPGIATVGAASPRQFVLGNCELVRFARLDHKFAAVAFADCARNSATEVTVTQPVENDVPKAIECLTKLRSGGLRYVDLR